VNRSKTALSALAGSLAVLALLAWERLPQSDVPRARPAADAMPSAMIVLTERETMPPHAAPASPEVARAPNASAIPQLSKSQQLEALVSSRNPTDAYAAYRLVYECLFSRSHAVEALARAKAKKSPTPDEACGDLSPGQITTRMQWLNIAADAGVHGAAMDVNHEGPDGGWEYFRDTPIYGEWEKRFEAQLAAGVTSADPDSLFMSYLFANGFPPGTKKEDPARALQFVVAWEDAVIAQTGKSTVTGPAIIEKLKATLPPDEAAAAIEAGKQIVISAKTSPYWHRP
jgi:hypothetical protein